MGVSRNRTHQFQDQTRTLRAALLERRVDRCELSIQVGAQPVDYRNDRKGDARRDQTVLNRGCPGFVRKEFLDVVLQLRLR